MSNGDQRHDGPIELENMERWVAGKNEQELISDLKVYLARLRDNPRAIPDRLRVAAIQQRLGRSQEALIHYEGVLRGYVHEGRLMSAITLCQRILTRYPDMPRIQRLLTALYARAPHGSTSTPSPVTPIRALEERPTTTFVVEEDEEQGTDRNVVVNRVFPEVQASREPMVKTTVPPDELRPTVPYEQVQRLQGGLDDVPTMPKVDDRRADTGDQAVLLTTPKTKSHAPKKEEPEDDGELVVLLTKKKKKNKKNNKKNNKKKKTTTTTS